MPPDHAGIAPAVDARLTREARVMTRYLLDRECPPEMLDRYARGTRRPDADRSRDGGDALADFAFAHPWSLPCLDAAAAVLPSGAVLRGKLHLMTAILEAAPTFATDFLPRHASRAGTLLQLAFHGAMAVAKALIGLPLLLAVTWRRR
ncbi:MAG: hypothetical protein WD801_00960 [Gemmatimonadaceae bacterium]